MKFTIKLIFSFNIINIYRNANKNLTFALK